MNRWNDPCSRVSVNAVAQPVKAVNSMPRPARVLALYCILSCALCLSPAVHAADTAPQPRALEHNGVQRTFYVALPADYDPVATYWPLVMVHGGGGNAAQNRYAAAPRRPFLRRAPDPPGAPQWWPRPGPVLRPRGWSRHTIRGSAKRVREEWVESRETQGENSIWGRRGETAARGKRRYLYPAGNGIT